MNRLCLTTKFGSYSRVLLCNLNIIHANNLYSTYYLLAFAPQVILWKSLTLITVYHVSEYVRAMEKWQFEMKTENNNIFSLNIFYLIPIIYHIWMNINFISNNNGKCNGNNILSIYARMLYLFSMIVWIASHALIGKCLKGRSYNLQNPLDLNSCL